MFLVFFFLAGFSLLLSKIVYGSYLSPIGIFGLVWNGMLFLFEIRLLNYYPLSVGTYVALIGSYLVFVFGVFLSLTWDVHTRPLRQFSLREHKSVSPMIVENKRARKVITILNFFALVGLFLMVWKLARLVGWTHIFDMTLVRDTMRGLSSTEKLGDGGVGYLSSLLPLSAVLSSVYLVQVPFDRFRAFLNILISMGYSFIFGNRTIFIWALILFVASYIIAQVFVKRVSLDRLTRPLLIGIILLSVVFGVIGSLRFNTTSDEAFYVNVKLPWFVLHTYSYVTAGIGAFNIRLDNPPKISIPGLHTFSPGIRMLAKFSPKLIGYNYATIARYTITREYVATPVRTNVYTYLGGLFNDFGWWGIFLGPFMMGWGSGLVFIRLLRKPSFVSIGLYAFFCLQVAYTSTLIITHANAILVSLLFLIVISKYVSKREKNVPSFMFGTNAAGVPK